MASKKKYSTSSVNDNVTFMPVKSVAGIHKSLEEFAESDEQGTCYLALENCVSNITISSQMAKSGKLPEGCSWATHVVFVG